MKARIILGAVVCSLSVLLASCLSSVNNVDLDASTMVSPAGGLTTYEEALHAEANRLLRYNASLTPKEAAKQAGENVDKTFYPEPDHIEEAKERKKKAAQAKFEEEFYAAMKK